MARSLGIIHGPRNESVSIQDHTQSPELAAGPSPVLSSVFDPHTLG